MNGWHIAINARFTFNEWLFVFVVERTVEKSRAARYFRRRGEGCRYTPYPVRSSSHG